MFQIFLDYPLNTPWLFYLIRVHTIRGDSVDQQVAVNPVNAG